MKVKLKSRNRSRFDREYEWLKTCEPFVVNPRGKLIHRVQHAHKSKTSRDGLMVHYWCGNCTFSGPVILFSDPPKDRLLCVYCEMKATATGEKSAKELTGRHVHVGRLKPVRTCCTDENN